jgi:hypothetical protein
MAHRSSRNLSLRLTLHPSTAFHRRRDVCKNLDHCLSIVSESGEGKRNNEIGGSDVGGYKTYTGHDPKHALELRTAHAIWMDLEAAREAVAKGGTVALDLTSERFRREEAALQRIIGN